MTTVDQTTTQADPYTRTLAEFALGMQAANLPADVAHEAARVTVDCVGSAIASLITPAGQAAIKLARNEHGPLEARVIGADRATMAMAALANEVLTNGIDFEVYGPEGHVCAVVVPAALAVADALDASGPELLAAIVAGIEIGGRIGGAIRRPGQGGARSLPLQRGHPHAGFAVAAAAGRLLKLSSEEMVNAFGIAGYSATLPSLAKFMIASSSPMTKYDHLGVVTQNGINAVLIAQHGFTGDATVLEGEIPFWQLAGAIGCDWDFLTADLGSLWTIHQLWYKPYPIGLPSNAILDLVRQMVREHNLAPQDITSISVRIKSQGPPRARKEITNAIAAWSDLPYNVAVAIFDIHPWRAWQEPQTFRRPDILALSDKVNVGAIRPDEVVPVGSYWEGWAPVRMTIEAGGRSFEGANDYLRRLTDQELSAKFQENVGGLMPVEDAVALEQACWNIGTLASARDLTRLFPTQMPARSS